MLGASWFAFAVGVASRWFTARPNSFPLGPLLLPSLLNPCGVGKRLTNPVRVKFPRPCCTACLESDSPPGVGTPTNDEHTPSEMRSADILCRHRER